MDLFRTILPTLKHRRGYLAVLRKRPDRLTPQQRQRRDEPFAECPAFRPIYKQMQKVWALMRKKTHCKRQCRPLVKRLFRLITQLRESGLAPMVTLAKTLWSWREEVACMWRFSKNNGIIEGFHRKMKLIQRRAYGFRNFNNYRLRVIAQCR
jgi:transposase